MKHMVMGNDKQSKDEEQMDVVGREDEDDEQDGYFSGYAHFSIHHDMLSVIINTSLSPFRALHFLHFFRISQGQRAIAMQSFKTATS